MLVQLANVGVHILEGLPPYGPTLRSAQTCLLPCSKVPRSRPRRNGLNKHLVLHSRIGFPVSGDCRGELEVLCEGEDGQVVWAG